MANWQELDQTKFSIAIDPKTGISDSSADEVATGIYYPNMLNANRSVEYNVAQFNFRGIKGTLVDKQLPMGTVYQLEIYFQGADHIRRSTGFMKASESRSPWIIIHPYYGTLNVQPISAILYDNSQKLLNVTKITGTVMETIQKSDIKVTQSAPDVIAGAKKDTDIHYAANYLNIASKITVQDTNAMTTNVSGFYAAMKIITTGAADIINAYNKANAAIQNAVNDASTAITLIQAFVSIPSVIADTIARRVSYLINEYGTLVSRLSTLTNPSLKALFQNNAGTCISSMCVAATYNISDTDYAYSQNVLLIINNIVSTYNSYLTNLDFIQTDNGGELDSFIPDITSLTALTSLVNYTISALLVIAANAKQQRVFALTKDNNWINIAYELYGLLPDDSTITQIMQDNNVGRNEMLQVRKGRNVIYYV